MHFVNT